MQQRQVKEGIDAVIVDSVLAIRKGLTQDPGLVELEAPPPAEVVAVEEVPLTNGKEPAIEVGVDHLAQGIET